MNLQELSTYLQRECYQPSAYHVGPDWGRCGDALCIEGIGGQFEIFYVERGERKETFGFYESEPAACEAFLALLNRDRFSRAHCVGLFSTKSEADRLSERLVAAGIVVHCDSIPFGSVTDMRHRVIVFGRDKIRAEEMIGQGSEPASI
jgi:hypothetical protein